MTTVNKNILKIYLLIATLITFFAYTVTVIQNIIRSPIIILNHSIFYSLLTIVFLIIILLITNKIVEQVFNYKKINYIYQFLFITFSIAFIYEGTPRILHYLNKKDITINAKITHVNLHDVKTASHRGQGSTYYYNGYVIETPFSKLNGKEIFNFNDKMPYHFKENEKIQIKGTISDYIFKINFINLLDKK